MADLRATFDQNANPSGNLFALLGQPNRAVPILLSVFIVFWTMFATLSRFNLDLHGDMVENFAWGIGWELGYYKHPPMFSWISAAWLTIFPRTNAFYHMLSAVNIALAAWAMWRISTRFFTPSQQVLLVAMVFFLPPLTFLSLNYNATSAMMPFWAFLVLFYIRTLENRRPLDALLVGVIGGMAMLVKYHSVVILLAIFAHALVDRDARSLFRTSLPWIAAVGGLLVVAPHVYWLYRTDFMTVSYASNQGDGDWLESWIAAGQFLGAIVLYALPALLLNLAHRYRGDGRPFIDADQIGALSTTVEGRALVAAISLPLAFTVLLGLAVNAELSSLWSIPFFVFYPFLIVLLLPASLASERRMTIPIMVGLFCAVSLMIAPIIKDYTLKIGRSNSAMPIQTTALAVQALWRTKTDQPLTVVAAELPVIANGLAFYAPDRPYAMQLMRYALTPWVQRSDVVRDGAVVVCGMNGSGCPSAARSILGRIDAQEELTVEPPEDASKRTPHRFRLFMRLPS